MAHPLESALKIFVVEFAEQAEAITGLLLRSQHQADANARAAQMDELFRYAHTIKGTAGSLGLAEVEELGHAIETALSPCRSGEQTPSPALTALVLQALDVGLKRVSAVTAGEERPDAQLSSLATQLVQLGSAGAAMAPSVAGAPVALPAEPARPADADTVRLSTARLDALERQLDGLREVGIGLERRTEEARRLERALVAAQAERRLVESAQGLRRGLTADAAELGGRVEDIDGELRLARTLTVDSLIKPLSRAVFEHAHAVGKEAQLHARGTEIALDRRLLDALRGALMHLVRNAVDHGLEEPATRARQGKPGAGKVELSFEQRGRELQVEVRDDGAGVDLERVRRKALEKGLLTAAVAQGLDAAGVHELLFAPGFSTSETVTRTSGRGVGLDVVRDNVQRLGGRVRMTSTPGAGSSFVLQLPLTLATAQGVLFEAGPFTLALPLVAVRRALHVVSARDGSDSLSLDGRVLPLRDLGRMLGLELPPRIGAAPHLLVRHGEREIAMRVDRLIGERELVFKPLPTELARLQHLASAAPLGDGRLAYMLNPRALLEADGGAATVAAALPGRTRIVVADDSLTTRTLHRQVLEAAGFEVETAANGEQALDLIRVRLPDLVVSDVQMPRLDGLGLARRIRAEKATAHLPVILISSLDSEADRERARQAGASAYLTKQAYRRGELLQLVRQMLGGTGRREPAP